MPDNHQDNAVFTTSPAIVLNRVKHTDSTLIVSLYTEALGSVSFSVRIPKTSRAGVKPVLFQPLNLLTVEWDHRTSANLQRIRNIHVLTPYSTLPYEPKKAPIASFLAELMHHALKGEQQGDVFAFIQHSLLWFDQSPDRYEDFHLVFLTKLARFLGFAPNTDNDDELPFFDLINGEYCRAQPLHNYYLRHADAQYIPLFMGLEYYSAHHLRLTSEQRMRALKILITYYRLHLPSFPKLHSLDVMGELL